MGNDFEIFKDDLTGRRYELLCRIFARGGLSRNTRHLCTMAFLQAEGDQVNLGKILDIYIENKDDFRRAYEVLLQGYLFCGYPRAIESFFSLNEIMKSRKWFERSGVKPVILAESDVLLKRGERLTGIVHKDKAARIRKRIDEISPDLGYLMIAEGYGHILGRDGLDSATRELAIVASLTSLDSGRQLNSHIRGAKNVGCEAMDIYEAIITGSVWIDSRKVLKACEIWSDVTGLDCPNSIDNFIF